MSVTGVAQCFPSGVSAFPRLVTVLKVDWLIWADEERSPDAVDSKQGEAGLFCSVRSNRRLSALFWLLCQEELGCVLCLITPHSDCVTSL